MNTLQECMNTLPESVNTLPESVNTLPESVNTLPESMNTLRESVNTLRESRRISGIGGSLAWTSACAQRWPRPQPNAIGVQGSPRMRAKARSRIQPRARRSASAGEEGVANLPAAEAAGTTPPDSQQKRDTHSSCGGRLRGRTSLSPLIPRARATPSAGLHCACAPPRARPSHKHECDGRVLEKL